MNCVASIVIPTYNAGSEFALTLGRIHEQDRTYPFEVLVIDSGSSDGTVELSRKLGVRVLQASLPFQHGKTRNEAISQANGDIIVLLTQDAVPFDNSWLDSLVSRLISDHSLAGAYSRQIPRHDCRPHTRRIIQSCLAGQANPRRQSISDPALFNKFTLAEKLSQLTFDNVSSAIRRSVWETFPLPPTGYGEDIQWARQVLMAGWCIAYEPSSMVIHSHERSRWYECKRAFLTYRLFIEMGIGQPIPWEGIGRRLLDDTRKRLEPIPSQSAKLLNLWDAVSNSLAVQIGQYLGSNAKWITRRFGKAFNPVERILSQGV